MNVFAARFASWGLLAVLAASPAIAQEKTTLGIGHLSFKNSYTKQVVSIKNDLGKIIIAAIVECGFFRQGQLIAASRSSVANLAPGATGFTDVSANTGASSADRVECRVAEAMAR